MTTAYSPLLGLALPVTGELSGTWGDTVNVSITSLLDSAVAGTTTLSTDADVTLTTTTGAANTSREAILLFSGARTVLRTITAPAQSKIYTVINATTGGFGVKVVGAGPTTGVTIAAGESAVIAWNGSDFIKISNTGGAVSFTNVTVTGTTTLSGLTASTALALDASKNVVSVTNTGTGNNVLATSPTLVTPALGTPSSGVVTNLTGTASININGTVGATTANTGAFTTLSSTGNTTLGDATTDTVQVNGYMGVGAAAISNAAIYAKPSALSGTTQNGVTAELIGTSAATVIIRSFLAYPRTEAASFTVSDLVGFYANNATKGAGSTITNQHGVYVADQTQGTNNYGITSLVSSGTNKWNIYASGTAANYFAGSVGIGTSEPATYGVDSAENLVIGQAAGNAGLTISSFNTSTGTVAFSDVINATVGRGYVTYNHSSDSMTIGTLGVERVRIDSAGNVGIGTNSPGASLESSVTSTTTPSLRLRYNATSYYADHLMDGNGNYIIQSPVANGVTSGNLRLRAGLNFSVSTNNNAAISPQLIIDTAGNVGIGVTPSAWASTKAIQVGAAYVSLYSSSASSGSTGGITNNAYYDGTNWTYINPQVATRFVSTSGAFQWQTAPVGTAGAAITFTQAMTLSAAGGLSVGTATDPGAGGFITTGNTTLGDATTDTVQVNGYMGVGVAPSNNIALQIGSTSLLGAGPIGFYSNPTGPSTATTSIRGIVTRADTAAAAFTVADVMQISLSNSTKGAGSTITNQHGAYIVDQTNGTNNYGITSLVSSGTNKWNIYASGTAQNYFAGTVGIGTSSPQGKLSVSNAGADGFEVSPGLAVGGVVRQIAFNRSTTAYMPMRYQASEHQIYNATTEVARVSAAGGLSVGTTTDPGAGGFINTGNTTLGDASTDTVQVNGYMGVGGAGAATSGLRVVSSALTGIAQYGVVNDFTASSAATTGARGVYSRVNTAVGTYTIGSVSDFYAGGAGAVIGAGSTITNAYGLFVEDHSAGTNNYGVASAITSGTNKWNIYASGTAQNYFAGNVGIGVVVPLAKLHVVSPVAEVIRIERTATDVWRFGLSAGAFFITDVTAAAERMRIDSAGNLLVGQTSVFAACDGKLSVTKNSASTASPTISVINANASAAFIAFSDSTSVFGSITRSGSSTVYNTSSDYRLKNITGPITTSGAYIDSLKPVEGTWKADGSTFVGLIAHEAQEASRTQVATGVKDGEEMQSMSYSSSEMIANLIAEIQDLRKRLAAAGI